MAGSSPAMTGREGKFRADLGSEQDLGGAPGRWAGEPLQETCNRRPRFASNTKKCGDTWACPSNLH